MSSSTSVLTAFVCVLSMILVVQARPQAPGYYFPYSGYPYGGAVLYDPSQNEVAAPASSPTSSQQQGVESRYAPGAQYPWLSIVYDSH